MSGKLDQSLDDIVKDRRAAGRRNLRPRQVGKPFKATGPAGGITKNTKPAKNAKAAQVAAATTSNKPKKTAAPVMSESKVVVTGLPADVTEQQIKEYFAKTIGPVKKAILTYGPAGQSRGIATITFAQAASAVQAAKQLNGVKVDNRAMKIEVVVGADQAPAPKALSDRVAQPKAVKAKPAAKSAAAKVINRKSKLGPKRGGPAAHHKPKKTAEQLDAEMTDYFGEGATANAAPGQENAGGNGKAQGEVTMEDEIM